MAKPYSRNVRFGEGQWELIQEEAGYLDINPSQYIRECTFTMTMLLRLNRYGVRSETTDFLGAATAVERAQLLNLLVDEELERRGRKPPKPKRRRPKSDS